MPELCHYKWMQYFDTRAYLKEYYSDISPENKSILEFFAEAAKKNFLNKPRHLELGCGPTLYQAISIAPVVEEMIYTDGFEESLSEVNGWIAADLSAFNWDKFIQASLLIENGIEPSEQEILEREKGMRNKITKVDTLDISDSKLIQGYMNSNGPFGSVSSVFALEVPAKNLEHLKELMSTIYNCLENGGVFTAVMVEGGEQYKVGDTYLPNLKLDAEWLKKTLQEIGFAVEDAVWKYVGADREDEGYKGIMMISVLK